MRRVRGREGEAGPVELVLFSTKEQVLLVLPTATFSSVVIVGTMPDFSILWMAAAETSARSASCWSDRPRCNRRSRSFGPIELTMRSRVESPSDAAAVSAAPIPLPLMRPSLTGGRNQYSQCLLTFRECPVGSGAVPAPRQTSSPRRRAVTPKTVARTVIVGGGAGGIGAAGAAKAADPQGEVIVYTEYEDAAYSPCGIPYVHGKEIPDFDRLFLAGKEAYVEAGIDIHYNTRVSGIDLARRQVSVEGQGDVAWDRL